MVLGSEEFGDGGVERRRVQESDSSGDFWFALPERVATVDDE